MTDGAGDAERVRNRSRYALAHGTRSIAWSAVDLLLAWHLHVVVGLSGFATSTVLFVFLLTGSIASLAIGYGLSDARAPARVYVRLQLYAAVAAALLLACQFLAHDVVAVIVAGLGFRIAFAIQDVTQNCLASLLPDDDADTDTYARLHIVLSSGARLVVLAMHLALARLEGMAERGVVIGVMAVLTVVGAFGLRNVAFPETRPSPSAFSWRAKRPGLGRLLAGFALATMLMPTLTRLLIFLPAVPGQPDFASVMVAAYYIGSMTGPIVHARIGRRDPGRDTAPLCAGIAALSCVVVLLPAPPLLREAAAAVHGVALSMLVVRLWAGAAFAARSDASDGFVFGSVTFTMHIAAALGALALGPLIEGVEAGSLSAAGAILALTASGAVGVAVLAPGADRHADAHVPDTVIPRDPRRRVHPVRAHRTRARPPFARRRG